MDWKQYFEMMADWKKLPAYRAEPRIDSLIGYYLSDFAADFLLDPIVGIIPELPIRLGTVRPADNDKEFADRSYKVDFYLLGRSGLNYFVEFKTDSGSRRPEQDDYLTQARGVGMAAVVRGIRRISDVSSYKRKYSHLLSKLSGLRLMNEAGEFSGSSEKIEIVYIQPRHDHGDARCIDFPWISAWVQKRGPSDGFESELAAALLRWSKD